MTRSMLIVLEEKKEKRIHNILAVLIRAVSFTFGKLAFLVHDFFSEDFFLSWFFPKKLI